MPDGSVLLLTLDAVWIALLALAALAVYRETGLLQARLAAAGSVVPDGLEVGAPVPRDAAADGSSRVLLFLFSDCAPCHEIGRGLANVGRLDRVEAVIHGVNGRPDAAETLASLLPADVGLVEGDRAESLTASFRVRSGPLGIAVRDGLVVAKSYLRSTAHVEFLIDQAVREGTKR